MTFLTVCIHTVPLEWYQGFITLKTLNSMSETAITFSTRLCCFRGGGGQTGTLVLCSSKGFMEDNFLQ